MKLSLLEAMVGDRPLAEKFDIARSAGFDGLDLRGDMLCLAPGEAPPRPTHVGDVIDEVRRESRRTGIVVPTVYGRLRTPLLSATVAERAQVAETIRERLTAASAVGATSLIVVPIFGEARIELDWPGGVEEAERALLAVLLRELEPAAAEARVQILLEPLNRRETHLLRSPADTAVLTRRLASPWIATMADTYHMDLEGQDLAEEFAAAADQVRLIHMSDRERTLPGQGGIDFGPLVARLRAENFEGWLGFECRGPLAVDDLRRSVAYVRGL